MFPISLKTNEKESLLTSNYLKGRLNQDDVFLCDTLVFLALWYDNHQLSESTTLKVTPKSCRNNEKQGWMYETIISISSLLFLGNQSKTKKKTLKNREIASVLGYFRIIQLSIFCYEMLLFQYVLEMWVQKCIMPKIWVSKC